MVHIFLSSILYSNELSIGEAMKILAFDLDGTCLSRYSQLSSRNAAAIKAAAAKGVLILPATGRNLQAIPDCIKNLTEARYIMTANGANIYDRQEGRTIYSNLISNEEAKKAQTILDDYAFYTEYYVNGQSYSIRSQFNEHLLKLHLPKKAIKEFYGQICFVESFNKLLDDGTVCPEKVNMAPVPAHQYDELKQRLLETGFLSVASSYAQNMEYNALTATKGHTLEAFARHFGITADDVMALGDGGNDVSMLKYAGFSFAMKNGVAEAKKAAKFQTDSCDSDGFAKAIEQYIL